VLRGPAAEFRVADADALNGNIAPLLQRFTEQLTVDDARALRGSVLLLLPVFDPDPRPNWGIPEYRTYIARVDETIPHFPYFLTANPFLGQIRVYLAALVPLTDAVAGTFRSDQMIDLANRKAVDVAKYSVALGVDPEDAVSAIYLNLPIELVKRERDIAAKFEKAMRPMLDRIRSRLPSGEKLGDIERPLVVEIGQLYDMNPDDYASDSEYLDDLLARMPRAVTSEELRLFDEELDAVTIQRGGGVLGYESARLVDVIRRHPRAAEALVIMHVKAGASQPGYLRYAAMIAAGIAIAFNDRWPMKQVEGRAAELGLDPEEWTPTLSDEPDATPSR
jgi:hypothetical protein